MSRSVLLAVAFTVLSALAEAQGYNQPTRPQVHFSPQRNWTNDPNGLVFFRGEYHLFYQYNPFGDQWGHMSWGHAVSPDLLHWHELPVAIPETGPMMIFTGSVVVDHGNSSGLCLAGTECLVAIFTGHTQQTSGKEGDVIQTQNLASSQDSGRTWTMFPGNPVLDLHLADFRDPAVSWNEQSRSWVMAVSLPREHKVRFYTSPDLKQWTQASDFGPTGDTDGDWECPDLLQVPSSDPHQPGMWALKVGLNPGAPQGGSGEQFFLGSFDGRTFSVAKEAGAHGWTNYGKDDYCAISYNGLPAGHRPVLLGWMSNWQYAKLLPTEPFRGQMSLARELTLLRDGAGLALQQTPVVDRLRSAKAMPLTTVHGSTLATVKTPFELIVRFAPNEAEQSFGLRLQTEATHYTDVLFDRAKGQFRIDRTHSGLTISPEFAVVTVAPLVKGRPYDLHLVVDRTSVEAYAQTGTIAMTDLIFPPSQTTEIRLLPGTGTQATGQLWPLHSIWKQADTGPGPVRER